MDEHQDPDLQSSGADRDELIARLMAGAGRRPQPARARMEQARGVVHTEWRRATDRRRRTLFMIRGSAALLTAVAAGVVFVVWQRPDLAPPAPSTPVVGTVARIEGTVTATAATNAAIPTQRMTSGTVLRANTIVETDAAGRAALVLGDGVSLRLDTSTRVVLFANTVVTLERGAVYVDAAAHGPRSLLIQTRFGDVRHVGTQFEVREDRSFLHVRVREGAVLVRRADAQLTAKAGEALSLDATGQYTRDTVSVYGAAWNWAMTVAPQYELEGRTVSEFLDWVAREQGWRWRFVDTQTAARATDIKTHGSIDGLTPEEALAVVLPTCGLSFTREGNELVVSLVEGSSPAVP